MQDFSEDTMSSRDAAYLGLLLEPIRTAARYLPKFGQRVRQGLTLDDFEALYAADPFYSWLGLDTPMVYGAHRAAGGITSVYRQIGLGCERLIREILVDSLSLSQDGSKWSYAIPDSTRGRRTLSLDARIQLAEIRCQERRLAVQNWILSASDSLEVSPRVARSLSGIVFEIRQGYKSKDSKRQNADIANAAAAYAKSYLPCLMVLSQQIDADVLHRYRQNHWVALIGTLSSNDALASTYVFFRDIVGFDLAEFFRMHQETLRREVRVTLEVLLSSEEQGA